MSEDRTRLFGALAVGRQHVTQEQLEQISPDADQDQAVDELLVERGFLTAAQRQELWSEVERLEESHQGDVSLMLEEIQKGPGETTLDEKHTSTSEGGPTAKPSGAVPADGDDPPDKPAASPDLADPNEQSNPFEETSISQNGGSSGDTPDAPEADQVDPEESNPFEETVISKGADASEGFSPTIDRGLNPHADETGETVDYRPEMQSRYTLTRVHGEGGLGQVWLATDPSLQREIALKRIRPGKGSSRDAQLRLIREAQITGQLEHPNIIPVYELEQYDEKGRPYYTMKFLRGDTLQDRIKSYHTKKKAGEQDPLDLIELLNSFIDICNAIAYAAARGIVHRDLKPQNVMIGDFGEVLVLDWGLAQKIDDQEDDSSRQKLKLGDLVEATETVAGQVVGLHGSGTGFRAEQSGRWPN